MPCITGPGVSYHRTLLESGRPTFSNGALAPGRVDESGGQPLRLEANVDVVPPPQQPGAGSALHSRVHGGRCRGKLALELH